MKAQMPKKLIEEPIIDAIFELRFSSSVPASSILPGILFGQLSGEKNIEKLPASQLPEQIRLADPNLRFAPLTRITCGDFVYLISDRGLAVACKLPYPGWTAFKLAIFEAMCHLDSSAIVSSVQRYSLKYVDMIPAAEVKKKISLVDLKISVGKNEVDEETFQVRVDFKKDNITRIVQIFSNAEATLNDGTAREGLIIDIDTINDVEDLSMEDIKKNIGTYIDELHEINVKLFFDCLRPETIRSLGPIYE